METTTNETVLPTETEGAEAAATAPMGTEETYGSDADELVAEETVEVVPVDYTPVIHNSAVLLANVILCAALIIVGFLAAVKFWGMK